jgi:hypothetical protein
MLIRPESSIGMLLLVSGGYLLWNFNIHQLITRLWLPAVLTALLFTGFAYDWAHTNVYVRKVEPEIEYKMMARHVVEIGTMKTAEDSVKYLAACQGLWFDYKTLTPEYLRSLQLPALDINPNQATNQKLSRPHSWHPGINLGIQHIIDVCLHVFTFYKDYTFIGVTILALIVLSLFNGGNSKSALQIALFSVYTFGLIYIIDFNAFMIGERHFIGIQIISLLVMLFYFFGQNKLVAYPPNFISAALMFMFIGDCFTLYHYKQRNNACAKEMNYHMQVMQKLEQAFQNRIVVISNENYFLFDKNFSVFNHQYTKNKYILFDVFTYSLTPNYLNYLNRQCNCDPGNPVDFFQWLSDNRALYISRPERFELTEKYMRLIHHQKLSFKPIEQSINDKAKGKDYDILKVGIEK